MKCFAIILLLSFPSKAELAITKIQNVRIEISKDSVQEFLKTIKVVANNGCIYGMLELKKRKNINLSDKEMDSLSAYCNEVGDSAVKGIKDANGL